MRWLAFTLLLGATPAMALPQMLASDTRLTLMSDYFAFGIDSRCGANWFFLELREWRCARRHGERLEVYASGQFLGESIPASYWYLMLAPTPENRQFYMMGTFFFGTYLAEIDPLELTSRRVGPFFQSMSVPPGSVDHDADGHHDMLMGDADGALIMSLPGGAAPPWTVVRRYPEFATMSGQFDQDAQSELAWIEDGALHFLDSASGQLEPWQAAGPLMSLRTQWTGDWDDDGRDEIAWAGSAPGRLLLLDPDQSVPPVELYLGGDMPLTVLGRIDWDGDGLPELMLASESNAAVLDPRSGQLLRNDTLLNRSLNGPRHGQAVDWDADGDQDFVWVESASQTMYLMRNPTGPEWIQLGATRGRVVGYAQRDGRPVLVVAEAAGSGTIRALHVRQLDPVTLEELAFAVAPVFASDVDRVQLGDVHPNPGLEIVHGGSGVVRALALDGTLLWQRQAPQNGTIHGFSVGDASCQGSGCAPILMVERHSDGLYWLVSLDGLNGSARWTGPPVSYEPMAQPATDLDGDGQAELLWTASGLLQVLRADGTPAWNIALGSASTPYQVRQSPVGLAVLYADTTLDLRSPHDGGLVATVQLAEGGQCSTSRYCRMDFLASAVNGGTWVVGGGEPDFLAVRGDLTGPVESLAVDTNAFDNLVALAPDRLHAGDIRVFGYRYDSDTLSQDGFEDR